MEYVLVKVVAQKGFGVLVGPESKKHCGNAIGPYF